MRVQVNVGFFMENLLNSFFKSHAKLFLFPKQEVRLKKAIIFIRIF